MWLIDDDEKRAARGATQAATASLAYPVAGTRLERGELDVDARLADVECRPGWQDTARIDDCKKRGISRGSRSASRENMRQHASLMIDDVKFSAALFQVPGNCARIGIHPGQAAAFKPYSGRSAHFPVPPFFIAEPR
jgi:hypothetical protein